MSEPGPLSPPKEATARIIVLNGTSSAGKTSIAVELRNLLPDTVCYYASDQLAAAGFRPLRSSTEERCRFFDGFHRSLASFAAAGNDLLVEHIVEEQAWADDLGTLLAPFDTFCVGVHCDLAKLREREKQRGDRTIGEAEFHLKTHGYCRYDFEVHNDQTPLDAAKAIGSAWSKRQSEISSRRGEPND